MIGMDTQAGAMKSSCVFENYRTDGRSQMNEFVYCSKSCHVAKEQTTSAGSFSRHQTTTVIPATSNAK